MSRDIREGRWLQIQGRAKRAWARVTGNESLAAEASAEVITGALQESVGVARAEAARKIERGVDAIASLAKKTARAIGD
jgi:uncharacterized protein YjbJ (UPF0337 family)